MTFDIAHYGSTSAKVLLVQMADNHDHDMIRHEVDLIKDLSGGQDFCLKTVSVNSWNNDLSPWPAPAVFGSADFGDGAPAMLDFVLKEVLKENSSSGDRKIIILGGYSLAGLFALWAGTRTDCFDGIAAASPSVWFPRFTDYLKENEYHADTVYLSLGDREERTRNPVMAQVGNAIRECHAHLTAKGKDCVLEWNQGNHFREPDLRMAKAYAWVMRHTHKSIS